ncbi:ribonuclease P [Candidatus Woesearchaeota archaeon]|nr:ribonuclease P [Candidatus Woesearchaeota archaeon]
MTKKKFSNKQAMTEIKVLFEKSKELFGKNKELANNYVRKARNLAMKHRMRLPLELRRKFCKDCYSYLVPGTNSRVRTKEGKVVITCFECKGFTRIPHIKEIKEKRKQL